jgi:DNA helicase-2/ATP-dependent DNA helicase PcrA
MKGKFTIKGRAEKIGGSYKPKHFFNSHNHAHTEFISKLAYRIINKSKAVIASRVNSIYQRVYLDETQDFAGWDFEL